MKFVYLVPPKLFSAQAAGFEIARHTNLLLAQQHGWIFTKDYNPDNPPTLYEYVISLLDKFPLEISQLDSDRKLLKILLIDCYYVVTEEAHQYMSLAEQHFPDEDVRQSMEDDWVTMRGRSFRVKGHPLGSKAITRYAAMQIHIRPDKLDYIDQYYRRKEWAMPMCSPAVERISKKLADGNRIDDSRYSVSHTSENVGDMFFYWSAPDTQQRLIKEYEECLRTLRRTGVSMFPNNNQ